ncbi:Metabotropic glutamate receptor 8 [Mortierella antarctica]|nr:Metabotropic glutamate receptor 8 [Mortierella antarctica]
MSAAIFVTSNISAIIGDTVSWLSEYSASLTSALQIPQCSFSSISDELSSTALYNYFFRTAPSSSLLVDQFLRYVQQMGWHRVGIIYTGDAFGLSLSNAIARKASDYDIVITHWEAVYMPSDHTDAFRETMARFRDMGSLINFLLCTDADLMRALEDIQEQGMFGLPYVWITLNNVAEDIKGYFSVPGRPAASVFNGLIMSDVAYNLKGNPQYDQFYNRWTHLDPKDYPGTGPGTKLSHGEPRAYSCPWFLALGYQQDIQLARERGVGEDQIRRELISGQYPRITGNLSVQRFTEVTFDGPGGFIRIDTSGNPEGGSFEFFQIQNSKAVLIGTSSTARNGSVDMKLNKGAHAWPGLRAGQIPPDAPDWVNQNLGWVDSIAVVFGTFAFTIMLTSLVLIVIVLWRRHDPVIKASSPVFCALELVGIILTCSAIPLRFSIRSDAICVLYPMISIGGITLLLSAIVVKNVRIYKIFNNVYCNKYTISNRDLLKQAALVFLIFMIGPILYISITQPKLLYVTVGKTDTAYMCMGHSVNSVATTRPAYAILILVPIGILLAAASFLAIKTHHVPGNWSEAKAIAYAVYNLVFAVVAFMPTDEMQAVPVLVVGKHWFSRYLARWKSMKVVVITTLGYMN